jgi:nicotinamidase/pyrazinamidase
MDEKTALVIVDLQNDFLPEGALGVKDSDKIIPVINKLQFLFKNVVATFDWHPPNHKSFASSNKKNVGDEVFINGIRQKLWPDHCIAGTEGAKLSRKFDQDHVLKFFYKGTDPEIDSYSAFFDNNYIKSTGLDQYLKELKVKKIYFTGLTTEYCIRYSVIDAIKLGFEVYVIEDAIKPVNLKLGDDEKAIFEMKQLGAHFIHSSSLK